MDKISKDIYEATVFDHDFQKGPLSKALDMAKEYVTFYNRILVGGYAIDKAVRLHNDKLYDDNKVPDIDIISDVFHVDAYNFGNRLADVTSSIDCFISGISVIRGLHHSTMRVRINGISVLDVTYVPKVLYDKLPTISGDGFNIIHPHYQMIDQHRALSLPFENAPMETIIGRWKKDLERYTLLNKHFAIEYIPLQISYNNIPDVIKLLHKSKLEYCVGGYQAVSYWFTEARKLHFLDMKVDSSAMYTPDLKLPDELPTNMIPDKLLYTIYSDDFEEVIKVLNAKNVKYYNSVLDKIPRKVIIDDVLEVIDNKGQKIAAYKDHHYIVNIQGAMCYLLTLAIIYKNEQAKYYYTITKYLLDWCCEKYVEGKKKNMDVNAYMPFLPSTDYFGKYNWSESSILQKEDMINLNDRNSTHVQKAPKNAYPDKDNFINEKLFDFNPSTSPIYQNDGEPCEKFEARYMP
jgi:hypothetical protein